MDFYQNCLKAITEKFTKEKESNEILILQHENQNKIIKDLKEALNRKMDVKDVEIQTDEVIVKQEKKENIIEID